MARGKGAYTALPLDRRFQQLNNAIVIENAGMSSDVAALEHRGNFGLQCDRNAFPRHS
ncbi:MAG: hypothetical protein WBG18_11220 [Xanthobacteraceae bacterium]|jgi:hypothetical protein